MTGVPTDHLWLPYTQMLGAPAPLRAARTHGSRIVLDDGRSLTGLVLDDTPEAVRLIDAGGRSTSIRKDKIEEQAVQPVSLMPAGYDRTLTPEELADLVAFLICQTSPAGQVAKAP